MGGGGGLSLEEGGGGGGVGGLSIEEEGEWGCKQFLSLVMHGFCSSNALYTTSLKFRRFIFLLTPFDT